MDLTVITVTYQSCEYIGGQIISLITNCLRVSYEQIVVDNGSTDGTVELLEGGYGSLISLIRNEENRGFAAANNQALKMARGRYLLFLNPDVEVVDGDLGEVIAWMDEHPEAGVAGARMRAAHGGPHPALWPRPLPTIGGHLAALLWPWRPPKGDLYSIFCEEEVQEVPFFRGAFMLVRRSVIEQLGWAFDPRYFLLCEDCDLCREVRRLGYKVVYLPFVTCIDYCNRSFAARSSLWKFWQYQKSFFVYARKWHPPYQWLWLGVAIPLGFLLRTVSSCTIALLCSKLNRKRVLPSAKSKF